jgi:bile acid:Na+ symporter, BASS family
MDPLLIVIIGFGLIFIVAAALGNGLSITAPAIMGPLRAHTQLDVMLILSNFIVVPALIIGLTALLPFDPQIKMAFAALALTAGAPFIPWLVSLAKGDLAYSGATVLLLTIGTWLVLPLALPVVLTALGTGATPSIWLLLWPMLLFMLLPLVAGVFIRNRYPRLAMEIGPYLGPISITALTVHITLFLGYTWNDFLSLGGTWAFAFAFALPLIGMLVGFLLSPPYALSPVRPADPQRGTKIVSAVATAQQNTGAVICVAIFGLGAYTVAGVTMLVGAIVTIIVVMLVMAEIGMRYEKTHPVTEAAAQAAPAAAPVATGAKAG